MTREEQLACLKDRPCSVCKMRTDKGCISWECVFEQTPDEEKEPCDCISREEVCDYIAEFVNHEYATDRERELVKNIIDGIQHLPSIQPKPKTECSCEQIKWERDIAIEQLHELGYELGQKIEPCEDCISRKAVLDLVEDMTDQFGVEHRVITEGVISMLPPVTPKPKLNGVCRRISSDIAEAFADKYE